ncbi:hypothetical protein GCM10027053_47760 [Intrasporangium mesophilum]
MMPSSDSMLAQAFEHLHRAANLADRHGDAPFAAQVRLAAATLPANTARGLAAHEPPAVDEDGIGEHLSLALDLLDSVPPLEGPVDLQLCAWHIHELRRIATDAVAS